MALKWRGGKFVEFRQFRTNFISRKFESCVIKFNINWREDVKFYKNRQTNQAFDWDFLTLKKNRDFETASWKDQHCETHITAKKNETATPVKSDKSFARPVAFWRTIRHPLNFTNVFSGKTVS